MIGHDIGEGIRDVTTGDNLLRLPCFVCKLWRQSVNSQHHIAIAYRRPHQQEGEDDTAHEEPFADGEGNENAAVVLGGRTTVEDLVRPGVGGQHGDGGEDVGHVDKEGLEDDGIEPEVPVSCASC